MNKYETLVNILDRLRKEAPQTYKSYYPLETEIDQLNQARSRAFIHLYLKVCFGLLDFEVRESYITDGPQDGGIDAYYIDENNGKIYFIQSKFRTTPRNFQNKEVDLNELLSMDIGRITDGEERDENGVLYNEKIQKFIKKIQSIGDIGRYRHEVIILANLSKLKPSQISKLIPGFPYIVFDAERCYQELVFPVVSGTYYKSSDLYIDINLTNKEYTSSRISYPVETESSSCEITILFVPTIEIAKVLLRYKNSILKYNPRSYLDLSKNPVNKEIAETIRNKKSNEFVLLNNGITMLSDDTRLQERAGKKNRGQLRVTNPQIINGGQTAYTLSQIYEGAVTNNEDPEKIFGSQEVMLKVITFTDLDETKNDSIFHLIKEISRATNLQTSIEESDRRANDAIQIELQKRIFAEFGYFYERKRGEFFDGLKNKYIDSLKVIDREIFIRTANAMNGYPEQALISRDVLFREERFNNTLKTINDLPRMVFAYFCYKKLDEKRKSFNREKHNKFGMLNYGNALRYGLYAVVYAACMHLKEDVNPSNIDELVNNKINDILSKFLDFEEFARGQPPNKDYFRPVTDQSGKITVETNFGGYYKGRTVTKDLQNFFRQ